MTDPTGDKIFSLQGMEYEFLVSSLQKCPLYLHVIVAVCSVAAAALATGGLVRQVCTDRWPLKDFFWFNSLCCLIGQF